jgi:hypothetical protein
MAIEEKDSPHKEASSAENINRDTHKPADMPMGKGDDKRREK